MKKRYEGMRAFIRDCINFDVDSKSAYNQVVKRFGYSNTYRAFVKSYSDVKRKMLSEPFDIDEELEFEKEQDDNFTDKERMFLDLLSKRKGHVDGDDVCNILECDVEEVYDLAKKLRKRGLNIYFDGKNIVLTKDVTPVDNNIKPLETNEIIFGVASDIHFGSKHCQITHLNTFAEICRKKGVKHIFVPGDVFAGYNVYRGQIFEVYGVSAKEQEDSAIANLPRGFDWYILGGNHDYSFIRNGGGHNPLLVLESKRPDVHYLGFDEADIPLLPGVDCKLWHPSGGVPYSVSYRMQKAVEQISYSELAKIARSKKASPSIRFLLCGHLHIQVQAMFGSIFAAQCGSFEGQTGYLKTHGLHPTVGGYIIEAELRKKDGIILNFNAKFYVFPDEIEDDWKNYRHSVAEQKHIEKPIFTKE